MLQSTPGVPPIVFDQLCVVYHAETGNILHAHRVTTYQGGHTPTEESIRSRAIEHTQGSQKEVMPTELKTVFIAPDRIKPGHNYKINIRNAELLATKRKGATSATKDVE